jgi:phage terminase large subunit GpA-like protein
MSSSARRAGRRALQSARDGNSLMTRREPYLRGQVPEGVRFLIAAVDIQGGRDRRFVVQVMGYGVGLESWLIDRFSLRHLDEAKAIRLDMSTHVEHWQVLVDQVLAKAYPLADGSGRLMPIRLTACDSGGEEGVTDRAYAFYRDLRRRGLAGRFLLLKGAHSRTAPKLEERYPDTTRRKDRKAESRGDVPVWFLNTDLLKDIVHNNLGRPDPGPGYLHWLH